MNKRTLKRCFLLEGALGYIAHLSGQIQAGKIKTIQEVLAKLNEDGPTGSGALALLFEEDLKVSGYEVGFLNDEPPKIGLLSCLDPETRELLEKEANKEGVDAEDLLRTKATAYLEELKAKHKQQNS